MNYKRKKLNIKMMILADCIAVEEPIPQQLMDYIEEVSMVTELKAVAFKDVGSVG